jgi:chemotaxis protein methyltransferase CheR
VSKLTSVADSNAYAILDDLLHRHTGQRILANRHWRIDIALRPVMRRNSIPDIDVLANLVRSDTSPELAKEIVDLMLNNETCFFRDQANFALINGPLLDALRERRQHQKRIRIWSAACSTGQEPYSIAISLCENAEKWRDWKVQIIASDVSQAAVAQAKSGRFSQLEIQRGMPVTLMLKYFRQEGEDWIAKDELRNMIIFGQQNLVMDTKSQGQFELILCRNMLMYLDDKIRGNVLHNLAGNLAQDGFLVLGGAETVIGQTDEFDASRDFRGFYEHAARKSLNQASADAKLRSGLAR